MKIRFFLRGLGAGIILTALILCVGYRVNAPEQNIVEEAKKLGMVFPEGTPVPATVSQQPGDIAPESTGAVPVNSAASAGNSAANVTGGQQQAQGKVPTSTAGTANSDGVANSAGTKKGQSTKTQGTRFTVRGGLLSSSVAREMMEAGIIKSDKVLDDLLEKSGYAREIQAGTYFIPAGSSYEDIAKIITGRQ